MKIHEILQERFWRLEQTIADVGIRGCQPVSRYVDTTQDVHELALAVGHCQNRIIQQRARLREFERIQAGHATYWQRRAEAAEAALRELGDSPVSQYSQTGETVSAYYLRLFLETRERLRRHIEAQEHAYWSHNDL